MPPVPTRPVALGVTRRQIIDLLRRSPSTANDLASALGLTHNAVRSHLTALIRVGLVQEGGLRRGVSRPSVLYELVPRAESSLSDAYVPFVAQLLRALGERMTRRELDELMANVGTNLAAEWPPLRGDLAKRLEAANALLHQLGASTEIEKSTGRFVLRGHGCLLAEAVHGRPEVCHAVERMLAELVQAPVEQCCEHGERPRCCFIIEHRPRRRA